MSNITLGIDKVNGGAVDHFPVFVVGQANSFTLTLTCAGDADLPLTGGDPVAQDAADGPSSLYLSFPADTFVDFHSFAVTPPVGWSAKTFDQPYPVWALAPQAGIAPWKAGTSLSIAVAKVNVLSRNDPGKITADVMRIPPLRDIGKDLPVLTQKPGADLHGIVDFDFDSSSDVFLSSDPLNPIVNTLVFHLSNLIQGKPLAESWPADKPPTFSLSFATAEITDPDAAGALTTAGLAAGIDAAPVQTYADAWQRIPGSAMPWKLQPLKENQEVLGSGKAASVQFQITSLTSYLPEGVTYAYLSYADVPGYADGFFAKALHKWRSIPTVTRFVNVSPNIISAGEAVQLKWQTFAVTGLQLSYDIGGTTYIRQTPNDIALAEDAYAPLPLPTQTTAYYLDVLDKDGMPIITCRPSPVTITVNPYAAKYNSFVSHPAGWTFQRNTPVPITLTWDVEHATQFELRKATDPDFRVAFLPSENSWLGNVDGPTTFTLHALGEDGIWVPAQLEVVDLISFVSGKTLRWRTFGGNKYADTQISFRSDGTGKRLDPSIPFKWTASADRILLDWGHGITDQTDFVAVFGDGYVLSERFS